MPLETHPSLAELQEQIAAAATELSGAEHDLRVAMEVIPVAMRSEKRIIGETLQAALDKVTAARGKLAGVLAEQRPDGDSSRQARGPPRRS
jgi:hypothetical protein